MGFRDFSLQVQHTKVSDFADRLKQGMIMGTKCKGCGEEYYPPSADCPKCMSSEMEWIELTGKGKLITFTSIYVLPEHFAEHFTKAPFSRYTLDPCPVGIIEIENRLRVMGWIPRVSSKDIKIGMTLKAIPETLPDGRVTIVLEAA